MIALFHWITSHSGSILFSHTCDKFQVHGCASICIVFDIEKMDGAGVPGIAAPADTPAISHNTPCPQTNKIRSVFKKTHRRSPRINTPPFRNRSFTLLYTSKAPEIYVSPRTKKAFRHPPVLILSRKPFSRSRRHGLLVQHDDLGARTLRSAAMRQNEQVWYQGMVDVPRPVR